MDKVIWKSTEEGPYFLGNVLVRVRVVFLPNCFLILSLHKHRSVEAFLNKKNYIIDNNSIDNNIILYQSLSCIDLILKKEKEKERVVLIWPFVSKFQSSNMHKHKNFL